MAGVIIRKIKKTVTTRPPLPNVITSASSLIARIMIRKGSGTASALLNMAFISWRIAMRSDLERSDTFDTSSIDGEERRGVRGEAEGEGGV